MCYKGGVCKLNGPLDRQFSKVFDGSEKKNLVNLPLNASVIQDHYHLEAEHILIDYLVSDEMRKLDRPTTSSSKPRCLSAEIRARCLFFVCFQGPLLQDSTDFEHAKSVSERW